MFNCMPFSRHIEIIDKRQCNLNQIPEDIIKNSRTLEELQLDSNHIKEISKHVFRLQKLRRLALSDNEIIKVPPDISQLAYLAELDLSKNDISDIPENIKFCKNLQYLDISNNPIMRLPACMTDLRALTYLGLSDVSLVDLPPDIGKLSNLTVLELRDNVINKLPPSITMLTQLQRLDLGTNELEQLPPEIGKLNSLQELYVDGNSLEELPKEITELQNLSSLDLSENKLLSLPGDIGDLKNLNDLTLSQNCLEVLPHSIGKMKRLTILKLDRNRLITLTPSVGSCSSLSELILTENLLNELPSSIGNLKELAILNVDKNRLQELPSLIGSCSRLGVLSLRDNSISVLPDEVGKLEKLRVLDISGNRLQYLPLTIKNLLQCELTALWLSENQSKPMLRLQSDQDQRTGVTVLTCYLLPQQDFVGSDGSKHPPPVHSHISAPVAHVNPGFEGGPKVRFPEIDQDSVEEESTGKFERHDTPHPKHGPKAKGRQIDGHVIQHEGPKKTEKSNTGFRIGESMGRRSTNSGNEETDLNEPYSDDVKHQVSPQPPAVAALPVQYSRPSVNSREASFDEQRSPSPHETEQYSQVPITNNHDIEKAVNFTPDTEEDADEHKVRLQRKNTPHPLKTSAMSMDSTVAQEKVNEILNRQQQPKATSSLSVGEPNQRTISVNNDAEADQYSFVVNRTDQGLGLSIAGGAGSPPYKENDDGIFISKLTTDGPADKAGLQIGDKLVAVNHASVSNNHGRCVELMRLADRTVTLTIIRDRTAHIKNGFDEESPVFEGFASPSKDPNLVETVSTSIKRESSGFGFSVAGGRGAPSYKSDDDGIFISSISNGGAAERNGRLKVGDKVLRINGVNVESARHDKAVSLLTGGNGEVHLVVQRDKQAFAHTPSSGHHSFPIGGLVASPLKIHTSAIQQPKLDADDISPLAQSSPLLPSKKSTASSQLLVEDIKLVKGNGPLGLSIVGGSDHTSHPFGINEPGVFVSKVVADGAAAKTGKLRIGDRILTVNGKDITKATHEEAVSSLISKSDEICMKVRHDPQPPGLKELTVTRIGDERLGISISGGVLTPANPLDSTDEGIFVSKVTPGGAAFRDGRLKVGIRILEVNNKSMLGASQSDAAEALRSAGAHVQLLICDGFDSNLIPPSPDLSGSKDESFPSLKDELFTAPVTPLPTLPSFPAPPVPMPRSTTIKTEVPRIGDNVLITKTPPVPPTRTNVIDIPTESILKTTETNVIFTKDYHERYNGQEIKPVAGVDSKIPTKISPPKDLNLKSKAAPAVNGDETPSFSPTSPTKKPIGIPVPRPYVSKTISAPKPIITSQTPSPVAASPLSQEQSKIPTRSPATNQSSPAFPVNGIASGVSKSATVHPPVAPKPQTKISTVDTDVEVARPSVLSDGTNEILNDSSVLPDPIVQSRIPSANVLKSEKTPSSPSTPSGENPEKLSFNRKIQRFEHKIEQQVEETHKSKIAPPKKVPLIHRNDVERLREEETKKIATVGGKQRIAENYEDIGHYGEEGYQQIVESSSIIGPSVVRTKKAENRQKLFAPSGAGAEESRLLSAAEQRALDAEKRTEWRKARLKSFERDSAKADQVMQIVLKPRSEPTDGVSRFENQTLDVLSEEGNGIDANLSSDTNAFVLVPVIADNRAKLARLTEFSSSSNHSDSVGDDLTGSYPENGHGDHSVTNSNGVSNYSSYQATSTATEKMWNHRTAETRHLLADEIGFIDDGGSFKGSKEQELNNSRSS